MANWAMVLGMWKMPANDSRIPFQKPAVRRFSSSNSSRFSGGYSLVLNTVQSTAARNTAPPM